MNTEERIQKIVDYHTPELVKAIKAGNVDNPEEVRELVEYLVRLGIQIGYKDAVATAFETRNNEFDTALRKLTEMSEEFDKNWLEV